MFVTIREVADLAGVAPSTVSRVIAKSPKISRATVARVQEAMEKLKFVPNANARSLASDATKTIGLTISRPAEQAFANPFFAELIRGIAAVCQRRSYKLMLSMSSNPEWEVQDSLQLVLGKQVDGLILSSVRANDALVEALWAKRLPFVVIGRSENPNVYSVNNNNSDCAAQVTRHLLERGRRRIAFVAGPQELLVTADRVMGYRQALAECAATLPECVIETSFTTEGGRDAMSRLASHGALPDAVIAADDVIALGVMDWLKEQGCVIPRDVAVTGFNDDPVSAFVHPSLTTMRISTYQLGRESAQMLIDLLEGKDAAQTLILPGELVVRESS